MDVYSFRLKSSVTFSSIVEGISDYYGVILEVEWEDNCCEPRGEMVVLGLKNFLCDKFAGWASNGISVEIWNNLRNIVYESLESFVPHKTITKNRTLNITRRKLKD